MGSQADQLSGPTDQLVLYWRPVTVPYRTYHGRDWVLVAQDIAQWKRNGTDNGIET